MASNSLLKRILPHQARGLLGHGLLLSKIPELLDTVFLIVKKKKVILLHWYHHASVLAYSWFSFSNWYAGPSWYGSMNYSVHTVMYFYYAVMATKLVRLPKFISVSITCMQILQMIVGIFVQAMQYYYVDDEDCATDRGFVLQGSMMYGSYFVLFCHFFAQTYIFKKKKDD